MLALSTTFLSYFQLPLHYDIGTKALASFHKTFATHLSDHVQEWHRRRSMCRAPEFKDRVYMDWFIRLVLAPITNDVTSHFSQSEEETLQIALKFDLIYAQLDYVYTVIPDLAQPSIANMLGESHAADC